MGYIKLHRKLLDWDYADDPEMLSIWVHILLLANWAEKEWRNEKIPRGSFITSASKLALRTGVKMGKVQTALRRLKNAHQIETKGTSQWTLITVLNYDSYQEGNEEEPTPTPAPAPKEVQRKPVEKPQADPEAVNRVYALYPTKCPVSGRATGKSAKDKEKIARLLGKMTEEKLSATILRYIEESKADKSYFKNFATLLNNLPDYEEEATPGAEPDTSLFNDYR